MRSRLLILGLVLLGSIGLLIQVSIVDRHAMKPAVPLVAHAVVPLSGLDQNVLAHCPRNRPMSPASASIIAVSCNRTSSLLRVLPSWIAVQGVEEIVLVDWASTPPIPETISSDARVRLVRVVGESEWNLARAYNLAAQVASGEHLLKVDADTRLSPEMLSSQPIADGVSLPGFLRGCRDRAPDQNARHLNGVLLVRRLDFLAVRGYDERMRRYGYDDTDLYERLRLVRNLSESCLRFDLMRHISDGHATRGATHAFHILHRRATSGGLLPRWHDVRNSLEATQWALSPTSTSALRHHACELVATRRPPFFEELLRDSDELAHAMQEALELHSHRAIRPQVVASLYSTADLSTLIRVYESLVGQRRRYLAVRPMHGLASRLRAFCSAQAYARQTHRKLLVVWDASDVHMRARFEDLLRPPEAAMPPSAANDEVAAAPGGDESEEGRVAQPLPAPFEIVYTYKPALFPLELWRRADQMGLERGRRRNVLIEDAGGRAALFVTTASRLESVPPVDEDLYSSCIRRLKPAAAVRLFLKENDPMADDTSIPERPGSPDRLQDEQEKPSIPEQMRSQSNVSIAEGAEGQDGSVDLTRFTANVTLSITKAAVQPLRVGVHIRMLSDATADAPGIVTDTRPITNSSLRAIEDARPFRELCHHSHFLRAMRELERSAAPRPVRFYFASDSIEAYRAVAAAYPKPWQLNYLSASASSACAGSVEHVPDAATLTDEESPSSNSGGGVGVRGGWRNVSAAESDRRSLFCQRAALADLITLATTSDRLLLSHPRATAWTDVTIAMAPKGTPHQIGCKAMAASDEGSAVAGGGDGGSPRRSGGRGGGSGGGSGGGGVGGVGETNVLAGPVTRGGRRGRKELGGREAESQAKEKDLLKLSGREVPGLALTKVGSIKKIAAAQDEVKVRVHKTKALIDRLPAAVRKLRLVFLIPRFMHVKSLVTRLQQMLLLEEPPILRIKAENSAAADAPLDPANTIGYYFEEYGDMADGFLHVTVEL